MNSLFEALPYLSNYHISFVVLAALPMTILIQNFATAPFAFIRNEQTPGMPLNFDHSKLSFRVMRAYANSTENLSVFGWALLVAIIAGASPLLVNWLAGIYFVFRMAFWFVYYAGIGKVAGGPRTIAFVGALAANTALAVAAIWALLT